MTTRAVISRTEPAWEAVRTTLERAGVRFRSLRVREEEADVLVPPSERDRFDVAMRAAGFKPAPYPKTWGPTADRDRRYHYRHAAGRIFVVESFSRWGFDPRGGHSYRWLIPGLEESILDPGDGSVDGEAPPSAALCIGGILHECINRGASRSERLGAELTRWRVADPDAHWARHLLGDTAAEFIRLAALKAGSDGLDIRSAQDLRRALMDVAARLSRSAPSSHAARAARGLFDRLIHRRLGRRQIAVALLGPDGVGKTTAGSLLASEEPMPRARWTYRYNGRPHPSFCARLARRAAKGTLAVWEALRQGRLIRKVSFQDYGRLAEMRVKRIEAVLAALGARLRGSHLLDLIVLDRGLTDEIMLLSSREARTRAARILARALPGVESFAILLSDDPQAIHDRKQELTPAAITWFIETARTTLEHVAPPLGWTELVMNGRTRSDVATCLRDMIEERVVDNLVSRPEPASHSDPAIHFVVDGLPGPDEPIWNGVHKAVAGMAKALLATHSAVDMVSLVGRGSGYASHTRDGVSITSFERRTPLDVPQAFRSWVSTLDRSDLIVLNGIFSPSVAAVAWYLRRQGRRYVVATHQPYNTEVFRKSPVRKHAWWVIAERPMLRGAAGIQVLAPEHVILLRRLGVDTPTIVVPNGYEHRLAGRDSEPLRTQTGRARLLYFGRIEMGYKGLDLLLQAVAVHPDVELTIQGPDWGDEAKLRAMAVSLGIEDRIAFVGADRETPATRIMARYDVVCLPSRCEGFGLAALEGMIAGRPVLITDVGGLAMAVRAAGCGVVARADGPGIRDGLTRLLAMRSEWSEMGRSGRELALRIYGWEQIASAARKRYRRLAAGSLKDGRAP